MRVPIFLQLYLGIASAAWTQYFGGRPKADKAWRFNGKFVVTGRSCSVFYKDVSGGPPIELYLDTAGRTENVDPPCQWEGLVSPKDGNFYLYQLDPWQNVLRIFDLGSPATFSGQLESVANITGFTGLQMAISLKHSLLYFPEATSVRVFEITNPVSPKLIKTISTSVTNAIAVAVHRNYLYLAASTYVKRIALNSASYTETSVLTGSLTVSHLHVFDRFIQVTAGDLKVSGATKKTTWIDPSSLSVLYVDNSLSFKASILIDSNYLVSIAGTIQNQLYMRLDNFTNLSSPTLMYEEVNPLNSADAYTRLYWVNNFVWWPAFFGLYGQSFASYIPNLLTEYSDAYPKAYGHLENPLTVTGSLVLSSASASNIVLTPSVMSVQDSFASLYFATINVTIVSTTTSLSKMQKFQGGLWTDMSVGSTFTPAQVTANQIRVYVADSGQFVLSAFQLGATLPITLIVNGPAPSSSSSAIIPSSVVAPPSSILVFSSAVPSSSLAISSAFVSTSPLVVPSSSPVYSSVVPSSPPVSSVVPSPSPLVSSVVPSSSPVGSSVVPSSSLVASSVVPSSSPVGISVVPSSSPVGISVVPSSSPEDSSAVPSSSPIVSSAVPSSSLVLSSVVPSPLTSTVAPYSSPAVSSVTSSSINSGQQPSSLTSSAAVSTSAGYLTSSVQSSGFSSSSDTPSSAIFSSPASSSSAMYLSSAGLSSSSNEVAISSSELSSSDVPPDVLAALVLSRLALSSKKRAAGIRESQLAQSGSIVSLLSNTTALIALGGIIFVLAGLAIFGIRRYKSRKSSSTNSSDATWTDDTTGSKTRENTKGSVQSTKSTRSARGGNDLPVTATVMPDATYTAGNTTIADNRTALPLALPGYIQFRNGPDFVSTRKIGGGGMSEVFIGQAFHKDLIIGGNNSIVIKVLTDQTGSALFHQEISIMSSLKAYPYFVKLLGYSENPQTILMQHYGLGDLKSYLTDSTIAKSKVSIMNLAFCVSQGLWAMHYNGYAHSDIKAENILLYQDEYGRVMGVISDFGITKILDDTKILVGAFVTVNIAGMSLRYAAPEVFQNAWRSPAVICSADVYAYGILLSFMINRVRPYSLT